jgi:hypothetical protein
MKTKVLNEQSIGPWYCVPLVHPGPDSGIPDEIPQNLKNRPGELEIAEKIIAAVRECARTISEHLHYRPDTTPSLAVNQ